MVAILLIATAGCEGWFTASAAGNPAAVETDSQESRESLAIRTGAAQLRSIVTVVVGLSRCEPLPDRVATLTPAVAGYVQQILVEQGQVVKQGQVIVQLDPRIAEATLADKTAARDGALAALRLLESLPRQEEQNGAKLTIEQAKVAVAKAQAVVDRLRPLRANAEIAEGQMLEAELALTQAQLQQQVAEAQFVVLMLQPRPQAIDEAKTKIASAEAAVDMAKTELDLHAVCSPIAGVLDSLSCRLGQSLTPGTAIGEVVDAHEVDVVAWIPVNEARRVRLGQMALITTGEAEVPASDRGQSELPGGPGVGELTGHVTFIGSVADPQTGQLPIRARVDNKTGRLTVGQMVTASIRVAEKVGSGRAP